MAGSEKPRGAVVKRVSLRAKKPSLGPLHSFFHPAAFFFLRFIYFLFWPWWVFIAEHGLFIAVASLTAECGLQ